jgi:hypothetical protein
MDPFTSILTAVAGRVVGEAAQPLIDKGRRELVRRKIKKPGDALGILRYSPGPHQGTFSSLGLLNSIPAGVTQAQIQNIVKSNTFTALSRQLIAVHLCDAERIYKDRINDGLRALFLASLESRSTEELLQYYGQFFTMLDQCCSDVADELNKAFPSVDVGFTWASQTLLLATLANVEQHVSALASTQDRDSSQLRQFREAEETWRKAYVRAFTRTHERIELPDFDLRRLVHYSELYVTPNFVMLDDSQESDEARQHNVRRSLLYTSFDELLNSVDHTVILGDPGAGKSTASSIIGCRWCKDERRVCYILKVRNIGFTRSGFDLIKTIQAQLSETFQQTVPAEYISSSLLDGSALVVFDGLDELSETISGRLVSNAIEAASVAYPLARFVVTSRRLGYSAVRLDREIFYEYVLQPFNPGQVESYAKKWFAFRSGGSEKLLKSSVADFMQASDSIPDLRQNPLLLAVICLLHAGHSELPRSRPKIYRKCVELLLRTWDSHRGIGEHRWDLEVFESVLAEIAHLTLFDPEHRNGMTEAQVRDVAVDILLRDAVPDRREAVALAKRMIDLCRGRAWMFTDVAPGSPDLEIFSFTHQSFQEYFAAKRLVLECGTAEELARKIEKFVLDDKLEIFSQICISLSGGEKFTSGPSQVYLNCLTPDSELDRHDERRLLAFLIKCSDVVMLNRDALELLVRKTLRHMVDDPAFGALPTLMRSDYRNPMSIRHIIGEELRNLKRENRHSLQLIVERNPWLWEVALREGVVTLSGIGRLFDGYMHKMINDDYSCAAEWLIRSLHDKANTQEERSVCVEILERIARASAEMGICVDDGPESPYTLFRNNRMARTVSKALARYQSLTNDAVVGLVHVAMAFCEVSAYYQPGVITPADGVIYHFMQARLRRHPEALPKGISVLPVETRNQVSAWCQQDVSFFEWVDHSVETG